MKHTNKKGFTIVELVIVIAVIAILAAVLIPTFSNLIKKANQSSDIQAARQMNTVLAAEQGLGDDIDRVIDVLVENGYNANGLTPVTANHKFFYVVDYERVVLFDEKKGEVVFPKEITITENSVKYDLAGGVKYIDVVANDVDTFKQAISAGSEKITLADNFKSAAGTAEIVVPANAKVTLDLNGKNLSSDQVTGRSQYLKVEGELTIVNGSVDLRGIYGFTGGKIIIGEGATVNSVDANGGACVWNEGSELVITGGNFNALNGDRDDVNDPAGDKEPGIVNNRVGGKVTIDGGNFKSVSNCYSIINNDTATTTINGGNFVASRGVVCTNDGIVEINGGTFATEEGAKAHVVAALGGLTTINGGTFTGSISGQAGTLVINGGTFSNTKLTLEQFKAFVAEGKTVVENADGSWTVQ